MHNEEKIKARKALLDNASNIASKSILIGFDGFVDEIIHVVDTRESKDNFSRVQTIESLGKRLLSAAGKSANIELFPKSQKVGGNGPLMSMAASGAGCKVTTIGVLGYPQIQPVFQPLADVCDVISIGVPGHTDALEFADGKIMLGKVVSLNDVCWDRICEVVGEEKFLDLLFKQNMVAITNWTMLLNLGEIIEKITEKITQKNPPIFFFDFADPEKRLKSEIKIALSQLKKMNEKAPVILGVNLREAEQMSEVLGLRDPIVDGVAGLEKLSQRLKEAMGIHGVVVHSVSFAGACVGDENTAVEGPFCQNPLITTGAGDHFNGGFCAALISGIDLKSVLYTGVATSGWYVRNGGPSPSLENTAELLLQWSENAI